MSKLREVAFNNSDVKRVDFDVQLDITSGFDGQKSLLWLKGSNIPRVIREIKSFLLQISNRSKLSGSESKLPFCFIPGKIFNEISGPLLIISIPNSDFDVVVLCGENIWWQ